MINIQHFISTFYYITLNFHWFFAQLQPEHRSTPPPDSYRCGCSGAGRPPKDFAVHFGTCCVSSVSEAIDPRKFEAWKRNADFSKKPMEDFTVFFFIGDTSLPKSSSHTWTEEVFGTLKKACLGGVWGLEHLLKRYFEWNITIFDRKFEGNSPFLIGTWKEIHRF